MVVLHLVDSNEAVVLALCDAFSSFPEVSVERGDILDLAHGALVSPANSQGFMDGGVDRAYSEAFGPELERRVREAIARRPESHLPIGASVTVHTESEPVAYLIVAPTMLSPEAIPPQNCYRAMRAALRAAGQLPEGTDLFCPGMGTGVGMVAPADAAREMVSAYLDWRAGSV